MNKTTSPTKSTVSRTSSLVPAPVLGVLKQSGSPLQTSTRELMEARFQRDLSGVRVHTNDLAAAATNSIHAEAFTFGNDIVLGRDRFRSNGLSQKLIAHEIAHTIQVGRHTKSKPTAVASDNSFAEAEARVAEFQPVRLSSTNPNLIYRKPENSNDTPRQKASDESISAAAAIPQPSWLDDAIEMLVAVGKEVGELGLGFIPIVGDVYDVVTGIVGRTLITNEKLDDVDRLLTLAGVIPIPFVSGKVLRGGRKVAKAVLNWLDVDILKTIGRAIQASLAFIGKVWNIAKRTLSDFIAFAKRKAKEWGGEAVSYKQKISEFFEEVANKRPQKNLKTESIDKPSNVFDIQTKRRLSKSEVGNLPANQPPDLSPVSEAQKRIHKNTRRRFRTFVEGKIRNNPDHPLSFLWDRRTEKFSTDPENLFDAGRVAHQRSGAPEFVGIESRLANQAKGSRFEKKGVGAVNRFVDVGGVPVEKNTANRWLKQGKLRQEDIGAEILAGEQ